MYHTYNVSADRSSHSHQIMDEYGNHIYARAWNEDPNHPWVDLDRGDFSYAYRWIEMLNSRQLKELMTIVGEEIGNNMIEYNYQDKPLMRERKL